MEFKDLEDRLVQLGKVSGLTSEQKMRLASRLESAFATSKPRNVARRRHRQVWTMTMAGVAACAVVGSGTWYAVYSSKSNSGTAPAINEQHYGDPAAIVVGALPYVLTFGVHMVNPHTGWGLSMDNLLLRTTDGGKSWADVTPTDSSKLNAVNVDVISARDAYACGTLNKGNGIESHIYVTHDGGAHWTPVSTPGINQNADYLSFIDSTHGWLVTSVLKGDTFYQGNIYRTDDGGQHWSKVSTVKQQRYSLYPWVLFSSTDFGLTVGADINPNADPNRYGPWGILDYHSLAFYVTQDGGHHWESTHISLPPSKVNNTFMPLVLDMTTPRLVGNFAYTRVDHSLYVSTDKGHTWRVQGSASGSIYFTDPMDGWQLSNGQLEYSRDGGKTWVPPKSAIPGLVETVDFINKTTGWVTSDTGLYETTDGGNTWKPQNQTRFRASGGL